MARSASGAESWTLTATESDTAQYSPPVIGNGQLGVVLSRSGLGASRQFSATAVSRGRDTKISSIIPAISPIELTVTANGSDATRRNWRQTLDMRNGTVATSYSIPGLDVKCSFTALRSLPFATMALLELKATKDVDVVVTDCPAIPESLNDARITHRRFKAAKKQRLILRAEGTYNQGRDAMVSSVAMMGEGWDQTAPDSVSISLRKGQAATLWVVASTVTTADFADPWNESERQVLYATTSGRQALKERHDDAWNDLWKSDIIIEGNPELQTNARVALYNLYSAASPGSGRSIAPMGLSSTHYYGHIFWDADTWMLPVMAVLNPEIARDMVDYRINTLPQARRRAAAHGYKGAMFAWESDDLGEESTPTFALTGPLEHHVTADVANAAWLYFRASADTTWLREQAWPLLRDCADFWVSRAQPRADGYYSIRSVVGADEYAIGVDDNAFTNAAAMRNLEYALEAASILGTVPSPKWKELSQKLYFSKIPGTDVIAEYDGYAGQQIKQADVALLAYPLGLLTESSDIDRNLTYYDAKIDSLRGPAMSHSAMAVNYARMGLGDRAGKLIERAYKPNLRGPFHNLSESPNNDHVYFVTGAGGLLQALVFGLAGVDVDLNSGEVRQISSSLPANVRSITVKTPYGTFRRER